MNAPRSIVPPVLLMAFNRPDFTRKVLDSLRAVKPTRLYFAVDGPRAQIHGEDAVVDEVRAMIRTVDWDCDINTLFGKSNLGCNMGESTAVSWFFEHVEAGVIFEDDCLPRASFFSFAGELLDRFGDDERVWMISGNNLQFGRKRTGYDYYFSMFPQVWGWATWRRAWLKYDRDMRLWPEVRDGGWLNDIFGHARTAEHWSRILNETYLGKIDTWDFQWFLTGWINNCLAIVPSVNLVSNFGFGDHRAAHNKYPGHPYASLPTEEIRFPLRHPPFVVRDALADAVAMNKNFWRPSILQRLAYQLNRRSGSAR